MVPALSCRPWPRAPTAADRIHPTPKEALCDAAMRSPRPSLRSGASARPLARAVGPRLRRSRSAFRALADRRIAPVELPAQHRIRFASPRAGTARPVILPSRRRLSYISFRGQHATTPILSARVWPCCACCCGPRWRHARPGANAPRKNRKVVRPRTVGASAHPSHFRAGKKHRAPFPSPSTRKAQGDVRLRGL